MLTLFIFQCLIYIIMKEALFKVIDFLTGFSKEKSGN